MASQEQQPAGTEALEAEAGIKLPEIRREELAARQAARVMMKDTESCIKVSWDRFVKLEVVEHKVSPFGKMNIQIADMTSNTGISHYLKKEFTYHESMQHSKSKPDYQLELFGAIQNKIKRERGS